MFSLRAAFLLVITTAAAFANAAVYCPAAGDLVAAYGKPQIRDQGWTVTGGAAVATKAAFNLLGGYVEFDVDFSSTKPGVNANVYTLSPPLVDKAGFDQTKYCDGAKTDNTWCPEVDWIESNGACGAAATLHTVKGPGPNGCTAWGCRSEGTYPSGARFHMRVEYDADGGYRVKMGSKVITFASMQPTPGAGDKAIVAAAYQAAGAVIYSSQWVGWVPLEGQCGASASEAVLAGSTFSVSNLVISGCVIQGPAPRTCTSSPPTPSPQPAPQPAPPAPQPTPSPADDYWPPIDDPSTDFPSGPAPSPSPVPAPSPTPSPTPPAPTPACSGTWGQCGGINWSGPTCCSVATDTCTKLNDYYFQCLPQKSS